MSEQWNLDWKPESPNPDAMVLGPMVIPCVGGPHDGHTHVCYDHHLGYLHAINGEGGRYRLKLHDITSAFVWEDG